MLQLARKWKQNVSPSLKAFILKLFKWIVYGLLLIGVGFFVEEVCDSYLSKSKSIKTYVEIQETLVPPTIMICFNPTAKYSVLKKYNLTMPDLFYKDLNTTIFEEATYMLGRDFTLVVGHEDITSSLNSNKPQPGNISIEEISTFFSGKCYKLSFHEVEIMAMDAISLRMKMKEHVPNSDFPYVTFHFTSEENSYGIIPLTWKDGRNYLNLEIDLNDTSYYDVVLEPFKVKNLESSPYCSTSTYTMKCASQRW